MLVNVQHWGYSFHLLLQTLYVIPGKWIMIMKLWETKSNMRCDNWKNYMCISVFAHVETYDHMIQTEKLSKYGLLSLIWPWKRRQQIPLKCNYLSANMASCPRRLKSSSTFYFILCYIISASKETSQLLSVMNILCESFSVHLHAIW